MTRNLETLRERYETAKFAGTFKGWIFNVMGKLFMVYCVIRVISVRFLLFIPVSLEHLQTTLQSIYNVVFLPSRRTSSTTTYPDLITDLLAYLLSHLSSYEIKTEELASFSRQLSLVLVGIIILSSIRLVLRGATRVRFPCVLCSFTGFLTRKQPQH